MIQTKAIQKFERYSMMLSIDFTGILDFDHRSLYIVFCFDSHLPVKGLFIWCQGCSHGGHLGHIKDWFGVNKQCPTGCGHLCEFT